MSTQQIRRSQLENLIDQFKKLPADKIEQGQILLDKINSFGNYMTNDDIREINTSLYQKSSSLMNYGVFRNKLIGDKYSTLQDFQQKDEVQNKKQRQERQQQRIRKQNQKQKDKQLVEQQFKDIENYDLLNLSCSIKQDVTDFFDELKTDKDNKITISFLTKVSKCTQTNNFFLTFELFKDIDESDGFYDIKLLQSRLINKLKPKYKNNNVTFFQSEQVKDESIPNCKILYDCFSVNKEFRNEIIKTWILRSILLLAAYLNFYNVRKVYGLSTLLNYDIISRSRTTSNSWLRGISNFIFENQYMIKLKNSIRSLISTYISDNLNRRYQDYGSIRIIFHRELHDYSNILNLNNKSNMQKRINLMNKQLKYLEESNMDPTFTDELVHKLYDAFQLETFNNIIEEVKHLKDWFFKPTQSKSEDTKLQNDLNTDPVSLIQPAENINLLCIRTDMLTFALFEYFQLCFKNFNYSINQSETSSLDNGPIVSIYVENNQTFFQYFKINWNEADTFSDPYVYVQSVEKNGVVVLRNAATSVPKRITLQKFGEMFNNLKQGETEMKQKQQLKKIRQQTSKQGQTQMKQQLGQTKAKQQQQLKKIRQQQQISKLGQTNAKQKEINKVETKNNIPSLGTVTKDIKDVGKNVATNAAASFQRFLNPSGVNTTQKLIPTPNIWDQGMPLQGKPLQTVGQRSKTGNVTIDVVQPQPVQYSNDFWQARIQQGLRKQRQKKQGLGKQGQQQGLGKQGQKKQGQQQGNRQGQKGIGQSKLQQQNGIGQGQQGIGQPKLQQQPKSQGQQGNRQQSKSQGIGQQVQKGISQQGQKVQLQPKSQRQKAIQAQVRLKQIQQARKKQQEQKNRLKEFDIKQLVNYLKFGSTLSDEEKNTVFYDLYTKYPNYKFNKQDSQIISTFLNENSSRFKYTPIRTLAGKRFLGNQYAIKNGKIIKKF